MPKDPAFLFYTKDFYEGTRTMLPEERACYIDLLIYQHQNGVIPNDLKRVLMYCSGISEATLQATLQAKFKLTQEGWINEVLKVHVELRENYKDELAISGRIGQLWKRMYKIFSKKDINRIKDCIPRQFLIDFIEKNELNDDLIIETINKCLVDIDNKESKGGLKGGNKGGLSIYGNANAIANEFINKEKDAEFKKQDEVKIGVDDLTKDLDPNWYEVRGLVERPYNEFSDDFKSKYPQELFLKYRKFTLYFFDDENLKTRLNVFRDLAWIHDFKKYLGHYDDDTIYKALTEMAMKGKTEPKNEASFRVAQFIGYQTENKGKSTKPTVNTTLPHNTTTDPTSSSAPSFKEVV